MSSGIDDRNIDHLVELITQRVTEKLQQRGVLDPITTAAREGDGCISSDRDCINCGHCATRKPEAVRNILSTGADRIGSKVGINGAKIDRTLASMIDHTLLKPDATKEQLIKVCEEARQYNFATVCVNSANIPLVARQLKGSPVKPIAVVGFPLGAASTQAKAFESTWSLILAR
jgi:deoxyribose-phosphate aldolase